MKSNFHPKISVALVPDSLLGNLERKPEKFDGSIYVSRLLQINTDPATRRKDVVGFGATSRDQVIADFHRKRDVHQTVAMYATDFPSSKTIFCTSKAMRSRCDPRPVLQGSMDFFFRSRNGHSPFSQPSHLMFVAGRQLFRGKKQLRECWLKLSLRSLDARPGWCWSARLLVGAFLRGRRIPD